MILRTRTGRGPNGWPRSSNGANDIDALYQGHPPQRLQDLRRLGADLRLKREDFLAIVDAWRWMFRRTSARRILPRLICIATASPALSAPVGAGVRASENDGILLAITSAARCN